MSNKPDEIGTDEQYNALATFLATMADHNTVCTEDAVLVLEQAAQEVKEDADN